MQVDLEVALNESAKGDPAAESWKELANEAKGLEKW